MCSPEKLQLARDNKAWVFRKTHVIISILFTLAIMFVSVTLAFADVRTDTRLNCDHIAANTTELEAHDLRLDHLEDHEEDMTEVQFNLENICNKLGIDYVKKRN